MTRHSRCHKDISVVDMHTTDNEPFAKGVAEEEDHILVSETHDVVSVSEEEESISQNEEINLKLHQPLSNKSWGSIGKQTCRIDRGVEGAFSNDYDIIVDQLTNMLAVRLRNLIVSRPETAPEFMKKDGSELLQNITDDLRQYVSCIASKYRQVHYHNVEHALHVTMSVDNMIDKMTTQQQQSSYHYDCYHTRHVCDLTFLDDFTFEISSNRVLQFAFIFAALIHDVDHQGVPNATLVEEEDDLAITHNDRSVSEQNSLQISFSSLSECPLLKRCIMPDKDARKTFRKVVIDLVLATDISNPERAQINHTTWEASFGPDLKLDINAEEKTSSTGNFDKCQGEERQEIELGQDDSKNNNNKRYCSKRHSMFTSIKSRCRVEREHLGIRRSMDLGGNYIQPYASNKEGELKLKQHAVLNLLMNAADVAHTMQSFEVFYKWNERLFKELLGAYHADRIDWDPSITWFQNQIRFFDTMVIPLAKRIAQCGVFGSDSSEFLYHALKNKKMWIERGGEMTNKLIESAAREMLFAMKSSAFS